ncbi:MAG: hypothetical protein MI807_06470 [Verrucomicrobiales bacterium]|nr:hypothetical protein [Verrucomicrobiales bacterium]
MGTDCDADTFHVPTPTAALELVGVSIRMHDENRKALKDDPIPVEIEFANGLKEIHCQLVIRKEGDRIATVNAEIREHESALLENHMFRGYKLNLAPSALAESFLWIDHAESKDRFIVPFLRFIPDRHIDKETREASPDFRDEVSLILYQSWQVKPLAVSTDQSKELWDRHRKTGQEVLTEKGVTFPAGTVYFYGLSHPQIAVRNTKDNLKKIEAIVKEMNQ